ncbi:gamma-butyrobetaine hydroxylase-like domain-containing protein [Consotaella salsifontis]|uniref:DUF971 family protein n=1 Tax=Consotaella salsifontis TaxID=1365950 RepID=A0A1T4LCI2_9HYPH|nr:DUF971 domain-containing protein [Consotaella salsifontis]SJZ52224.1 DUF971 family protein [Consotaella salsifontis]
MAEAIRPPKEIRVSHDRRTMTVVQESGREDVFTAEMLRVLSPSAEVQGHGPGQRITVAGKMYVRISSLEPVGRYATRIVFDDGHSTGLYTWTYLDQLAREKEERWQVYLDEMAAKRLHREP